MIKTIEQRKNFERDLALAEETQRSLLPHELPKFPGWVLFAVFPSDAFVGGDFYDFQVMESGELVGILADVSGKGPGGFIAEFDASRLFPAVVAQRQFPRRSSGPAEQIPDRKIVGQVRDHVPVFCAVPTDRGNMSAPATIRHICTAQPNRKSKIWNRMPSSLGLLISQSLSAAGCGHG